MIFSSQIESLMKFEGRERLLSYKEVISLSPGAFALIGGIVAARFERQGGVIDEGIHLSLDIFGKPRRIGTSFVHILETLLDGHHGH